MFEFSHEANAALHTLHESLKVLVDNTINTTQAKIAVENDTDGYLHKIGKAALTATRAVELFVAATSESARQTGVFPTVIPRRPQPLGAVGGTVSFTGGAGGGRQGHVSVGGMGASSGGTGGRTASVFHSAIMKRSRSIAPPAALTARTSSVSKLSEAPSEPTSPAFSPSGAYHSQHAQAAAAAVSRAETLQSAHFVQASEKQLVKFSNATDSFEGIIATGAYFLLDILVRETLAREAVWYSYTDGADEAKAIAIHSPKPRASSGTRVSLRTGVVGAVIRSGMAINVAPEQPTETNPIVLCFPIFTAASRTHPIGVVSLLHKATSEPFSKADEAVTAHWTLLAARVMVEYGVDLTTHTFDPFKVLLNRSSPHAKYVELGLGKEPYSVAGGKRGAAGVRAEADLLKDLMDDAVRLLEIQADEAAASDAKAKRKKASKKGDGGGDDNDVGGLTTAPKAQQLRLRAAGLTGFSLKLSTSVAEFPPPFRVFHCVHNNHFTAVRGARLHGSGVTLQTQNLMDVAEYVQSLEDVWRRATEDLQGFEQEHVAQMDDFRARKRKLKAAQTKATELEHQRDTFATKYEALKVELAAVCGRPVDDAAFDPAQNADGDPVGSVLPAVRGAQP